MPGWEVGGAETPSNPPPPPPDPQLLPGPPHFPPPARLGPVPAHRGGGSRLCTGLKMETWSWRLEISFSPSTPPFAQPEHPAEILGGQEEARLSGQPWGDEAHPLAE